MKRFTLRIVPLLAAFLFTGCFNILHFIALNSDGNLDINWRLTLSAALQEKSKQSGKEQPLDTKLKEAQKKISTQLKGQISDFKVTEIKETHQVGMSMQLKTLQSIKLEEQDGFPLVPWHDKENKQLVFFFRNEKKDSPLIDIPRKPEVDTKTENKDNSKTENQGDQNSTESEAQPAQNEQMIELMQAIMSSARYQILLDRSLKAKKAWVISKTDGKKEEISILHLGDQTMIDFPFISFIISDKKGFDLVVELQ